MPKISQETIDEIRKSVDIVEIIKEYIPLTPKGKNYFGVCPFHQDHSPSMSVSQSRQMYKCFSCGAAGNVFKFVSDFENISFYEAIVKVGQKVGISLNISEYKPKDQFDSEYQTMQLATAYFVNNLNTEDGIPAKKYLQERGLNEEIVKEFDIGLSLSNASLYQFMQKKKIDSKQLENLGLINRNGLNFTDVFQNRIMFPIHNIDGKVVGFTGRIIDADKSPKYLNSRETIIFKKGNILFNYHRAKQQIHLAKKVIIVEGNMDAIRMYCSGLKNTIALMGTSLTKEQVNFIQKLHSPVILMFDNDNAGEVATLTNGAMLEDAGIKVDVVRLSGAKDPDEYIIKYGVDAIKDNIKHAISFLEFKLNHYKHNKNLADATELANYIKSVLKSLENKDEITIDITLSKLASEYNLSKEVLRQQIDQEKKVELPTFPNINPKPKKNNRYDESANHILYYMMNNPKYIFMYQTKLGYFKEEEYRAIANEIIYYYEKNKTIELADFLSYIELSPLKDEVYEIIDSIKEEELTETRMEDSLFNLREIMWKEKVRDLKKEQKTTSDTREKEEIGLKIVEYMKKIQDMKIERSVIND